MRLQLENENGNLVEETIYLDRTIEYIDYSPVNGVDAYTGKTIIRLWSFCLSSRIVGHRYQTRWLDVKRHLQKMVAKNLIFNDRLAMFFEAYDLLRGQEDFWVPSYQNTLDIFKKIIILLENNPNTIIRVQ